ATRTSQISPLTEAHTQSHELTATHNPRSGPRWVQRPGLGCDSRPGYGEGSHHSPRQAHHPASPPRRTPGHADAAPPTRPIGRSAAATPATALYRHHCGPAPHHHTPPHHHAPPHHHGHRTTHNAPAKGCSRRSHPRPTRHRLPAALAYQCAALPQPPAGQVTLLHSEAELAE